jgi:uncharacterized OsmC-like protein
MSLDTKHKMVNGIDVDALTEVIQEVGSNEDKGRVGFRVTTTWQEGTRSKATIEDWRMDGETLPRSFTILSDEPEELLGRASAPNPQELLMAGLNACMGVGYVALCALNDIKVESLEIESDGDLDLRGFLGIDPEVPAGYPELRYQVRIRCTGTEEQLREIHEMVMATSPNFYNLSRPVKLVPELVIL